MELCLQFKTFSQRVEDIDIDVYRSLHPLDSEPSPGSTFFRDCLVEWKVWAMISLVFNWLICLGMC